MIQKKYLTIFLSIFCLTAYAQNEKILLNYNGGSIPLQLPLQAGSNVQVDSNTGDLLATTSDTAEEIGLNLGLQPTGDAPNINFTVSPQGTTSALISATISNDAVYCNQTGLWSGLTTANPPTTYVTSVSESVTANSSNYNLTCANTFGTTTNNATVTSITTVINPVVTISANPTSVQSGASSTVTWSVTNNPTTCNFTGDWPSGVTKDGPYSFAINNITSQKTLSVLCDNSALGNSGTKTVTISVAGTTTCNTQPPILGGSEDKNPDSWDDAAPGSGFPGPWGSSIGFGLNKNQYSALNFSTGNLLVNEAVINIVTPGNAQGPIPLGVTISISECPGDFSVHLNQAGCVDFATGQPKLKWSIDPNQTSPFVCKLDNNKQYYFNIVHAFASDGYLTRCDGSTYCGVLMNTIEL